MRQNYAVTQLDKTDDDPKYIKSALTGNEKARIAEYKKLTGVPITEMVFSVASLERFAEEQIEDEKPNGEVFLAFGKTLNERYWVFPFPMAESETSDLTKLHYTRKVITDKSLCPDNCGDKYSTTEDADKLNYITINNSIYRFREENKDSTYFSGIIMDDAIVSWLKESNYRNFRVQFMADSKEDTAYAAVIRAVDKRGAAVDELGYWLVSKKKICPKNCLYAPIPSDEGLRNQSPFEEKKGK